MIHKAYMPVYSDPDFSCGTDGTDGTGRTDQPKVVQEVLADLKRGVVGIITRLSEPTVLEILVQASVFQALQAAQKGNMRTKMWASSNSNKSNR